MQRLAALSLVDVSVLALTFGEQVAIELIRAVGTAVFVTVGGGAAAWWVTTRSQEAKARHERRTEVLQRVAALLGGLSATLDACWEHRVARARRFFDLAPEQWVGPAGEAVLPTDDETRRDVTGRIENRIGDPSNSMELRFAEWLQPPKDKREEVELRLQSLYVLSTEIRAYCQPDSPVLETMARVSSAARAQAALLAGELTERARREEFPEVLHDDGSAASAVEDWHRLGELRDEAKIELIEQLLVEDIRLG